jgi:hypothetical protein
VNTPTGNKSARRGLGVVRLAASALATLALGVSALAQTGPVLTINSPNPITDFGRLNSGTISPNQIITVSNSGTTNLTISNTTLTGVNPGDYTLVSTNCTGAVLAPGATCSATVRFNPLAVGTRNARLSLTDNAPGSPHLVLLTGVGLNASIPNRQVGPIDPRVGFPLWYQDDQGLRLALCLDTNGMCLAVIPNPAAPPSVTDTNMNFPGEAFYWTAEAEIALPSGGRGRLVLAKEAAFTTEDATVGNQITFSRIRIRIDGITAGATYTITHPYGVVTLVADGDGTATFALATADNGDTLATDPATTDGGTATTDGETATTDGGFATADCCMTAQSQSSGSGSGGGSTFNGEIDTTEDIGIGPSDFRAALKGKFSTYLRWPSGAPAGYIGDPNVDHVVTGSPFGTNFFRIAGPNVGGSGINTIQTSLFSVQGKIKN